MLEVLQRHLGNCTSSGDTARQAILSGLELAGRAKEKKEGLRTSVVSAYRWVLHPDEQGLTTVALPVPATKDETNAGRTL